MHILVGNHDIHCGANIVSIGSCAEQMCRTFFIHVRSVTSVHVESIAGLARSQDCR